MVLICLDRDGTINLDENYYLGSKPHWKEQLAFLPGVPEGTRLLNAIPESKIVIITNQSGIALQGTDFDFLTEERAHEVNPHIINALEDLGCRVDGYQMCPYVTSEYAKRAAEKGRAVAKRYIDGEKVLAMKKVSPEESVFIANDFLEAAQLVAKSCKS